MRALLMLVVLLPLMVAGQENRTSSVEGRVTITGGIQPLRVAMVQDADRLIKELEQLVGELPGKAFPIYVQLHPGEAGRQSRMRRTFFTVPEGETKYRLQIDLWLGRGNSFEQKRFERLLMEMLVIERTLRSLPVEETPERVNVRPWLVDGLLEALAWKMGRGDRRMYASLMESGGWVEVEALVDRQSLEGLDLLSGELFRASSGALVMALLSQTQGQANMGRLLGKVAVFEGEQLTLLRTHFPKVNLGQKGLERWWMLQVAAMSEQRLTQAMTIPETEERLSKILELHVPDEKGKLVRVELESWRLLADLENPEDRLKAVKPSADLLTHLSFRCFPTYRPVIRLYLESLAALARNETAEVELILGNLKKFREEEMQKYQKMVDLLDWYHLATVTEESGEFEDYLRVRENLEKTEGKRRDPVSRYLDQAQNVFESR